MHPFSQCFRTAKEPSHSGRALFMHMDPSFFGFPHRIMILLIDSGSGCFFPRPLLCFLIQSVYVCSFQFGIHDSSALFCDYPTLKSLDNSLSICLKNLFPGFFCCIFLNYRAHSIPFSAPLRSAQYRRPLDVVRPFCVSLKYLTRSASNL